MTGAIDEPSRTRNCTPARFPMGEDIASTYTVVYRRNEANFVFDIGRYCTCPKLFDAAHIDTPLLVQEQLDSFLRSVLGAVYTVWIFI